MLAMDCTNELYLQAFSVFHILKHIFMFPKPASKLPSSCIDFHFFKYVFLCSLSDRFYYLKLSNIITLLIYFIIVVRMCTYGILKGRSVRESELCNLLPTCKKLNLLVLLCHKFRGKKKRTDKLPLIIIKMKCCFNMVC